MDHNNFPALYPIVNSLTLLTKVLEAGADIIQIRIKNSSEKELIDLTKAALELRNKLNPSCKIIINDSVKTAALCDGVHLGQEDQDAKTARKILGDKAIIGLSTHNIEQIKSAPIEVLNYIALGPIFKSKTKSGHAPEVGLEKLKQARQETTLPLIAIGGINIDNAKAVYTAGADSIACIAEIEESMDLKKLIAQYRLAA